MHCTTQGLPSPFPAVTLELPGHLAFVGKQATFIFILDFFFLMKAETNNLKKCWEQRLEGISI